MGENDEKTYEVRIGLRANRVHLIRLHFKTPQAAMEEYNSFHNKMMKAREFCIETVEVRDEFGLVCCVQVSDVIFWATHRCYPLATKIRDKE